MGWGTVWKISIHYAVCPPTLKHWTRHIAVPRSCASLRRSHTQETVPNLLVPLKNILLTFFELVWWFCWYFYTNFSNFVDFFPQLSYFVDFFGLFGHFVDLFGLVSQLAYTKIPLCASSAWTILCQMPPPPKKKIFAQSCYYTGHIWHNMYFFSLGWGQAKSYWGTRRLNYTWGQNFKHFESNIIHRYNAMGGETSDNPVPSSFIPQVIYIRRTQTTEKIM